ncbi:HNH endonuclease [Streptomyces sioyaensis]|uniref:HNH endonuclease n=1 Tax=Streptomyces sioyaensis TaxID=67364 RepID=UPI003697436D
MSATRRRVDVGRNVSPFRPASARSVPRLTPRITLRPQAPPHTLSRQAVLRLWEELDWFSCTYCDTPFGQMVVCEVDHVVPLAGGGVDELWNLAPACAPCNRAKTDLPVSVWLTYLAGQSNNATRTEPA